MNVIPNNTNLRHGMIFLQLEKVTRKLVTIFRNNFCDFLSSWFFVKSSFVWKYHNSSPPQNCSPVLVCKKVNRSAPDWNVNSSLGWRLKRTTCKIENEEFSKIWIIWAQIDIYAYFCGAKRFFVNYSCSKSDIE